MRQHDHQHCLQTRAHLCSRRLSRACRRCRRKGCQQLPPRGLGSIVGLTIGYRTHNEPPTWPPAAAEGRQEGECEDCRRAVRPAAHHRSPYSCRDVERTPGCKRPAARRREQRLSQCALHSVHGLIQEGRLATRSRWRSDTSLRPQPAIAVCSPRCAGTRVRQPAQRACSARLFVSCK